VTSQKKPLSLAHYMRLLKSKLPCYFPVYIRTLKLSDDIHGECQLTEDNTFLLKINKNDLLVIQKDTLFHEYAHVLAWTPGHMDLADHSASWGVAYARIWRTIHNENEGADGSL